jgi:hypothetical protein
MLRTVWARAVEPNLSGAATGDTMASKNAIMPAKTTLYRIVEPFTPLMTPNPPEANQ